MRRVLVAVLGLFAGVTLLVAAFLIFNTFSIIVAQRTRELALLRAVGAGRAQMIGAVLAEAAVVGVVASAAGLGAGVAGKTGRGAALAVVMAAERYPASPATGDRIDGLDASVPEGAYVYHAGTRRDGDAIVTAGGRVLTVGAHAASLAEARDLAYRAVSGIRWRGEHHRSDIGHRALG